MLVSYCNCEKMGHVPSVARGCHTNYNGSLNTTIAGDIDDIIYTTHPHIVILCILTNLCSQMFVFSLISLFQKGMGASWIDLICAIKSQILLLLEIHKGYKDAYHFCFLISRI